MQTAINFCSRVDDHQAFFLHVLYLLERGDLGLAADELACHLNPKLMISKERQRRRSSMNRPIILAAFKVEFDIARSFLCLDCNNLNQVHD